jgi:preprotein translocase SecE subunit
VAETDSPSDNRRERKSETVREVNEKARLKQDKIVVPVVPSGERTRRQKFAQAKVWAPLRFIARFPLIRYFINSGRELKLVTWPNARQTFRLTYAVMIFAVVFGVLVALVDYGLDKVVKEVIIK